MKNVAIYRMVSLLLVLALLSGNIVTVFAQDGAPELTAPTEEPTVPVSLPEDMEPSVPTEPTDSTEETQPPEETPTEVTEATEAIRTTESEIFPVPWILPMGEDPEPEGPNLYFGQLHAHSSPVSGADSIAAVFAQAAKTTGMDFFAITDHSDSFDNAASGDILDNTVSQYWAAGKAAAQAATTSEFVAMYGFEMSWPERFQLGHIGTFCTPGFQSWNQEAYSRQTTALQTYYETLSEVPDAIGQWNHPGNQYGTFSDFDHYSEAADRFVQLLEVDGISDLAGSSGYLDGYWYYNRMLDRGWHVAPVNNAVSGRTVLLSEELTEAALSDAMANRRAYATEDWDLEISYTMDGFSLGSVLKPWQVGQSADIVADLYDPTDAAIGTVEVIVDGGTVAARQTVSTGCGVLRFLLPPQYRYYYLRITQPDGDVAVTAPIWIEGEEQLGISGLSCETEIPVQRETVSLLLELYNREAADFLIESLEIYADGALIGENAGLSRIPAGETLSHRLSFRYEGIGQTEVSVVLSGTLARAEREYEESLSLSFRQSDQVTDIVVDGSHGNIGLTDLTAFQTMAAAEDIRITVISEEIGVEDLQDCRFLLVNAPRQPFTGNFLSAVGEYVRWGGSVILCGEANVDSAEELNRLLEAMGSTMRLTGDTLSDALYNGSPETLLFPEEIRGEDPWCAGMVSGQLYRHNYGCSVSPGQGTVLVTARPTTVSSSGVSSAPVLCREDTAAGGTIFAAGSFFLGNAELQEPANLWALPYANRTIARNLLGIGGEMLPLSTIRQMREAEAGTVLRIRGYVTAGTANQWNHFPDTLYVQDDTGGIGAIPFTGEGIAVGTPVEIIGAADTKDGNRIIKPISWNVPDGSFCRHLPGTGDWKTLLDPILHGGELVEVEGECTEVLFADDGYISAIVLKDSSGNMAHVLVEDYIFSGATGKNNLHETIRKGRTVRAAGILHVDETGAAVIRVRNCEEVVYVPPRNIYINPRTGHWLNELLEQQKRRGLGRGS